MAQPLLKLKDSAVEATSKKKKPFSRPRKSGDGAPIARVVSKKPKEQKQPVVVKPDVPEKKSQKRKCVAVFASCRMFMPDSNKLSQEERKVQREAQSEASRRLEEETRGQEQTQSEVVFRLQGQGPHP